MTTQERTYREGGYNGDILEEIYKRLVRVETRLSNVLKIHGVMPSAKPPMLTQKAVYQGAATQGEPATVYVTGLDVTLAEVALAAVRGQPEGAGGTVRIVIGNQLLGELFVHGNH